MLQQPFNRFTHHPSCRDPIFAGNLVQLAVLLWGQADGQAVGWFVLRTGCGL